MRQRNHTGLSARQRGAVTLFSAVMILLLLTEMVIYATTSGVFEQRKSSNEMRNKLAFHTAESGIQQAKEYLLANAALLASPVTDLLPDGTDGWLSTGNPRWVACSSVDYGSDSSHPCNAESDASLRDGSYFYSSGGSTELPLNTNAIIPGTTEQVTVEALLCMMIVDFDQAVPFQGCNNSDSTTQDQSRFVITLLARGEADCNGTSCGAESLITEKMASTTPGGSGTAPGVPLVSKSTFPPSGTAEIVPNPNGSGEGVSASALLNANTSCEGLEPVDPSSGSWATCERDEFYEVETFPSDYACPWSQCECKESSEKLISSDNLGVNFDIISDPNFPCDLFEYIFGVPKTDEGIALIKGLATVIDDCQILDENSTGLYWATGEDCIVKSRVGSAEAPVVLVSATSLTHFNAGAELFGMLFVTDAEDPDAMFVANGHATVYGVGIIDAKLDRYNGTFQLVYLENVIENALQTGTLGVLAGGWSDFHEAWK